MWITVYRLFFALFFLEFFGGINITTSTTRNPQGIEKLCRPVEEGASVSFTCDAPTLGTNETFIQWDRRNEQGDFETVANCIVGNGCNVTDQYRFTAVIDDMPLGKDARSTLVIKNITRTNVTSETTWACVTMDELKTCYLQVHSQLQNVSCDDLTLDGLELKMTCRANKIYPQGACSFSLNDSGGKTRADFSVLYSHQHISENPIYFKSECTVIIAAENIGNTVSVTAAIFPNITDGKIFGPYHKFTSRIQFSPPKIGNFTANSQSFKVEVDLGNDISFACEAAGFPKPVLSIFREGERDSKVAAENGKLKLENVQCANTGVYMCEAESSLPRNVIALSKSLELLIKCALELQDPLRYYEVIAPNTTDIHIPVRGYPPPNHILLLKLNSKSIKEMVDPIYYNTNYTAQSSTSGIVQLNLAKSQEVTVGEFTVLIQNGVGKGVLYEFSRIKETGTSDSDPNDESLVIVLGTVIPFVSLAIAGFFLIKCCCPERLRCMACTDDSQQPRLPDNDQETEDSNGYQPRGGRRSPCQSRITQGHHGVINHNYNQFNIVTSPDQIELVCRAFPGLGVGGPFKPALEYSEPKRLEEIDA